MSALAFPPRCAARFTQVRLIGTGAHGAVYLATQVGLDRPVAVKLLHADVAREVEQVTRFALEARATASIVHPNVVVVIGADLDDDVPWIAYEYLPGETLHHIIASGAMPWMEALVAGRQVAAALAAAHGLGVLHRDVKPSNVIQAEPGHYKLTDFGLARLAGNLESVTRTGAVVGTPAYLAPEVLEGKGHTGASDLFSTGAMLYKLVTGRLPPRPDLLGAGSARALGVPPPSQVAKLPAAVDRIVIGCTHRDPAVRWASAAELIAAIDSAIADPKNGANFGAGARRPGGGSGNTLPEPIEALPAGGTVPAGLRRTAVTRKGTRECRAVAANAPSSRLRPTVSGSLVKVARRRPWPLALAGLLAVAALGGVAAWRAGTPGRTPIVSPSTQAFEILSPATTPRIMIPDPDAFRALVKRVRTRWVKHNEILALLNPLLPRLDEAARLSATRAQEARPDLDQLHKIAERLAAQGDLSTLHDEPLHWLVRTYAARCSQWMYLQVADFIVKRAAHEVETGNAIPGQHSILGSLEALEFEREGALYLRRYLSAAAEILERIARAPQRAHADTMELMWDVREVSRMRAFGRWPASQATELKRIAGEFKARLSKLSGPIGSVLGRAMTRFWDWGETSSGVRMTRSSFVEAIADLSLLADQIPPAASSIHSFADHMRREMEGGPAPARPSGYTAPASRSEKK